MGTLKSLFQKIRMRWRHIRKQSAVAVLVLAFVAFGSAFIGVMKSIPEWTFLGIWNWLTDSIYEAAQVLLLNMSPHASTEEFNFLIGVARVSSVLLVVLVATQAIGKLFKDSFDYFQLWCADQNGVLNRLRHWLAGKNSVLRYLSGLFADREIVFIGGLGRIGFQLATDYAKEGKLVVVQEICDPNHWTESAEANQAIVLKGDVTDIDSLRDHIFRSPSIVHLVTGNDLANINALVNIKKLRQEYVGTKKKSLGECNCYVHIDHPGLHRTLLRCMIESNCEKDSSFRIRPFNIYHETACQLILQRLTPIRPKKDEVGLYVIFGFEQMGSAMLKELVEFAHFENQKRSRILVLVPPNSGSENENAAESAYRACVSQWKRMTPRSVHSDLSHVNFDPASDEWTSQKNRLEDCLGPSGEPNAVEYAANVQFCQLKSSHSISAAEVNELARLAGAQDENSNVKPAVLFCFEEDEQNFRLANELNDAWQDLHGINIHRGPSSKIPADEWCLYERKSEFRIPVFVFLPRSGPLRHILNESADSFAIRSFGAVVEGIERAQDHLLEEVAMDIACSFDAEKKREDARKDWCNKNNRDRQALQIHEIPIPSDEELAVVPRDEYGPVWITKPFWDQMSNRNAAEHARVKMQILGYTIADERNRRASSKIDFDKFDQQDKVTIALVEHNRWMAERLLMGWCYGPKMAQPPQRLSMCPKSDLPDEELLKDFQQVKTVLEFLQQRGVMFHPVRTPPTHWMDESAITSIVN
jgi:hypothetical protein